MHRGSLNWYGMAVKPLRMSNEDLSSKGIKSDAEEYISPVVFVGTQMGRVLDEVKEGNKKLVTQVAARPQTGGDHH